VAAVPARVADDGVLARDVREAADVGDVGELGAAGLQPLVAAGADKEGVADRQWLHRRLEHRDRRNLAADAMIRHFHPAPGICAAGPRDGAEREPGAGEAVEAGGHEAAFADKAADGTAAPVGQVLKIDAAPRVAELRVAGCLEGPADGLAEHVGKRADLGDEGKAAAPDLADGAAAQQHPLARVGPVDAPYLDLGVVPAAVEDVGLGDPVRAQHAIGILRIHRQVAARAKLGGSEAALGLERRAVEDQRQVVVGEPEGHAVRAHDPPAPDERRRALVEMGLQTRRQRLHLGSRKPRSSRSRRPMRPSPRVMSVIGAASPVPASSATRRARSPRGPLSGSSRAPVPVATAVRPAHHVS
jgi:hypothetical protein